MLKLPPFALLNHCHNVQNPNFADGMAELSSASCWLGARHLLSCFGLRFGAPFARRCRAGRSGRIASPIQLDNDLSEIIAGLGGLTEGEALGVEIGHVTACFGLAGDRK